VESDKGLCLNNADFDSIVKLYADLVLTFCDVQAGIARELVLRGASVLKFNQRTVEEIFNMVELLTGSVGKQEQAQRSLKNCDVVLVMS
jgi:iron complex transport system substrate-binding protein